MWRYLLALLSVCGYIESVASQDCPRAAKIRDGICTTPCTPSTGCTESNSDCLCDSQCGYSCVSKGLSCGPAPTVKNADLTSTGTSFNDTVVHKCRPGFTMNGDDVRRCTAKGKWSGVAPNCMRVCKQPELPFGAYVKSNVKTEYNTGESIRLDCKKGFKKIGTPSRFCISGRWTAFPFECKATHSCRRTIRASRTRCTAKCSPSDPAGCPAGHKCLCDGQCGYSCVEQGLQCPVPNQVKNGFITYKKTGYNDTVTYRCKENYTLNGERIRRCTAKKRWEGAVPSCLPDCGQPKVPRNAYIENKKSKYASGDRVTFKCDESFNQEGIATTLCFMGRWNVMPFRCDTGGCGDPGTPDNGNKVGISYAHGKEVFFSCNIGYVRVGSEQRRCLTNNTWSGTQPTCKLLDCGPPKELRNGTIIGNETTFQKSISFQCDEGFELDRNPSAICQSDGKWSTEPNCQPLDCGNLDPPLHGTKRGSKTTFTNTIEFFCDAGYQMIGSAVRYCPSSGLWDGVKPTCQALDCGVLKAPVNGSIQGDKWTYPNSVRFNCDKGFDLIGSSVRTCQTDGTWGGQTVRCQAVDCGKLEKPQNGSLTGSQTTYPAIIVFQCDEGFLLKGSKYRKCQANRTWSGLLVSCGAVSCGKPALVGNGFASGKGITYPNVISYECDEGYLLNGPIQRQCQANGTWSGRDPTCDAISCGVLSAPMNGSKIGKVYTYLNDVTFSCDEGFDMIGSNSRVCLSNGSWSGTDTFCKAVDCGPLFAPMNGSLYGKRTFFPNVLKFECDVGFDLLGSSIRICLSNGKWSGNVTSCKAVDCGPLDVPQNGSHHGSSTVFPNVLTFSCDEGFLLRGSSSRVCQANRTWSGSLTRCEAVDCGSLAVPVNGSMYGNKTTFPNSLRFGCDEGFDLLGSSARTCLPTGKWNGNTTTCRAVDCGSLAVPQNGSKHGRLAVFPNTITFSCEEGFLLRGSSSRVCQANRTWSGSLTRCEAIDCGPVAAPMNGTMQGTKTVFPNILTFSCDEGFDLLGSSKRTCLSNGNWSGTQPSCQAVDCGSLAVPPNGSKYGRLTVFPNTITFSCDEGFLLRGSLSRVCQANRTWSGSLTRCEAVDCGPLASPVNGSLSGSSTVFPNKISFRCDEGFLLKGPSVRICQSNRAWSGEETRCQAIDCGSLDAPTNGSLNGELTVFPNKIRFTCDEGFDLLGSEVRSCLSNGSWSGSSASCNAVNCGSLAVPMNGSSSGSLTTYPNKISFACHKGFILIGSSVRTCLSNRNWSGTTTRCQAVDCGPLVVPMNGTSKGSLTVFPNAITFGCDKGFILSGSSNRQCQADGTWSGTNTICNAVDCGSLGPPLNGTKKGHQTVFPNVVQFACDMGFILQGSSDRICQANGTWSGVPATCNAVDCGSLAVPMNGSLQGRLTIFPNKIKFSCDVGFDLIGSSVRICRSNGLWSGTVTTCQAVNCGPVNDPKNGRVAATGTTFTQTAIYTCYDGFLLKGNSARICQASRTWSGKQPHCNAVDCGKLEAPANGAMRGQLTVFPNKVTFTCNDGFDLIGSPGLQCLANGRWSNITPTCKAVRCSEPVIPPNSYLTTKFQPYFDNEAVIYFSCKPGFYLRGTPIKTCWNGNWTKTEFLCLPPKCNSPHVPDKAYITFPRGKRGPYVENDKVYFSCNDGYYLKGNPFITCKGKWTTYRFDCHPVECYSLPPPKRGHIDRSTGTTFGQRYEFGCDWENGFKLEGSQIRVCQANKQWSGTQPFCHLLSCGEPKTPDHGIKLNFNYTYNNVVRFRCNRGYSPRGFRETRCQINSRWTGTGLICLPCSAPLGMRSRKIRSQSLSASSERDPKHSASHGRLVDSSAWCSARSTYEKYLQVDFGSITEITAIATQGHPREYKWVHEYHLKYALGAHWFEYWVHGKIKVFKGNRDRNTIVKRHLQKSIIAHKLRLYRHENTKTFSGSSVCVRMEVYGCEFYTKCLTVGTRVLARWYHWRKQTTYIMGYVREINQKTIGITPHDQHSSLTPGTVLTVSKSDPYYILKDVSPEEHEITNRIPVAMLLRGQDGVAVYPTGKVVNKVGFWYQVNLDNDEIAHWRRLTDIRLMRIPESCQSQTDNKLEIKK